MAVITALSLIGCAEKSAPFAGVWKANCADYWGVLITPVDPNLYAVTFCGLTGCLGPGEWTPDTPITGDPMYQIVSAKKLRIKRKGSGFFTYIQCDAAPVWHGR